MVISLSFIIIFFFTKVFFTFFLVSTMILLLPMRVGELQERKRASSDGPGTVMRRTARGEEKGAIGRTARGEQELRLVFSRKKNVGEKTIMREGMRLKWKDLWCSLRKKYHS